jgi:hypothetical protein
MRAYMTDAPLPLNPRNNIITASKKTCTCPVPRKVVTRDSNMARRTHVATYFGSEYSTLREVDDLKVFDNSNESQPPKLVCVYPGSAWASENFPNEVKVFLISGDPVATNTLGDTKKTEMNAKRYQSEVILKARTIARVAR